METRPEQASAEEFAAMRREIEALTVRFVPGIAAVFLMWTLGAWSYGRGYVAAGVVAFIATGLAFIYTAMVGIMLRVARWRLPEASREARRNADRQTPPAAGGDDR